MSAQNPSMSGPPRQFDPSAMSYAGLTAHVSANDLRDFRQNVVQSSPFPYPSAAGAMVRPIVEVVLLVSVIVAVIGAGVAIGGLSGSSSNPAWRILGSPVTGAVTIGIVAWLGYLLIRAWKFENPWRRWFRLHVFGRDNGLFFLPKSPRPPLSGTVFASPKPGFAIDRLVSQLGRRFEIGNFNTQHSDLAAPVSVWGYMAIGLDRNLPHMILASRHNARRSRGIPVVIDRKQVLSLEGDFDKHFTLFAPRQYERDALYVFSPDLMALMIDEASFFEVEIVDDWIFFYSPKPFDLTSRRTLRRLMRIARIVGAKTFRQTDRYWDDRTGMPFVANEVGAPGRRLRTRVSILAVIGIVVWVTIQVLRVLNFVN